ncbi:MAG: HD-GYP domain-containing protein [Methylibium sp.]
MRFLELFTKSGAAPVARAVANPPPTAQADGNALLASLLGMAWVVEARDPYTGGHLWRVSRYAALLCEHAGTSLSVCARVSIGAFLHDLGKVGIPDAILRKPAALTEDEHAVIQTHADVGARLLAGHPLASWALDAVQAHHERPDGRGYPRGLRGTAIPYAARVVALCDAFDAMTSTRPYRAAMPVKQALERLDACLGSQFDEALGRHFLALGAEGLLDHIAAHSDDGIPLQHCVMCGPTLVLRREQSAGDPVFCRNCGGEYVLQAERPDAGGRPLRAVNTGRIGLAADLQPAADTALIHRFLQDVSRLVPENSKT